MSPVRELSAVWPLEGETVEASALRMLSGDLALQPGDKLEESPVPQLASSLILTNWGFGSALEASGLLADMLVSGGRAVQLRRVAGASDLARSSGPRKKAGATGNRRDC